MSATIQRWTRSELLGHADAYIRDFAVRTVTHALENNPSTRWTVDSLCTWYGLRPDAVRRALAELVDAGIAVADADGVFRGAGSAVPASRGA